ncbi:MAG: periplasmic heavy metal sensor [Myxococcota bacterium]
MNHNSNIESSSVATRPWWRTWGLRGTPVLAGLALFGLAAVAVAGPGKGGKGGAGGVCAKLECSEDQRGELRTILGELRQDTQADREAIKKARASMAAEWVKDRPDEGELQRLQGVVAQHHQAMAAIAADALMEVHEILEPEQRAKLAKLIERRGLAALRRGGHKGKGKGKRGGKNKPAEPQD